RSPRRLIEARRLFREGVNAAVDVGVAVTIEAVQRFQHGKRLLGGGTVVQVGDRLAVDLAGKDRKLGTDLLDRAGKLGGGGRGGLHDGSAAARPPLRPPRGSSRSLSPRAARPAPGRPP